MIGIYKITNKETGQVYIGQSNDVERRIKEHQQERYIPIDMWINMLGKDSFTYEVLEECSLEELDQKEKDYIKKFNSIIDGYNLQQGGFNNSIGSGNGRAILNEEDVVNIRTAYANHQQPKEVFKLYQDRITLSQFQAVWQGQSWKYIMPEVFTPENKKYYISGLVKDKAALTKEEILKYRQYYVNHTAKETYDLFVKDKGEIIKERTFTRILTGDVRNSSIYKEVPIYSKTRHRWELNGEPVSTILGTEE